jgi:phosphohistidine phosphatase
VTTRRLVLIRHAKSAEGPVDIERGLNPRGLRDREAVGQWLRDNRIAPDRVVVSPATRARLTWQGAAGHVVAPEPVIDERIYDNDHEVLLELIRETPDDVRTLVLVGHNPSFGTLAYELDDGSGDDDTREELSAGFPTSATAVFQFDADWADVRRHRLHLVAYAAPRG